MSSAGLSVLPIWDDVLEELAAAWSESKQLKQIFIEMFSLLEHLPQLLSLKVSGVLLENDTLERLCAKLPSLTNVEVGYCDWNIDNPPEDTTVTTIHGIKDVRIEYRVPSPDCFSPGGRIQIPALLHTARTLILPGQIQRLSVLANHGLEKLLTQLASTKADFPRLASLAIICPPASSASDIVSFLRRCHALKELFIDRRDYSNRRIQWTGPDQKDERDSISSNSRALETVTFVSGGFLPALKAFIGSLDETIALLKLPGVYIERLEVHRTFEHVTREQARAGRVAHEPLPYEAIDELMDALETASPDSRNFVLEFKCVDQRWGESEWRSRCTAEEDAARKINKPPQRVHDIFPNLRTFAYRGVIFPLGFTGMTTLPTAKGVLQSEH
ncbi:hypothetical protein BKA62DRAFT_676236 [Auriculariales sp. MPI-PUGE-AT-0066]|nr:hypothetical protein BKA62DRAFT_676236 [Auriculariales sp. MPI-PUGE-AT-0066]